MSESATTATKTVTESGESDSTDSPLIADRWTNNISYRQLVASSCIGIVQLWWHPYIYDLKRLVPFLCLCNVFSILIGYPMFYLELALGVVTRKGVLASWDLAPIARGVGFAMLVTCAFTALAVSVVGAYALAQLVHTAHAFLPWLHCAAAARPACAARHRPLGASDSPAQSFFFNFVLWLKRDGLTGGLGEVVWELTIYFVIVWALVYFVVIKRIYSYSKLVIFKDILAYLVLVCCGVGCVSLEGSGKMFSVCDWKVLLEGTKRPPSSALPDESVRRLSEAKPSISTSPAIAIAAEMWREAIEYCLLEMTVSQGTLVMLGSCCPQQQTRLSTTVLWSFLASKTCCMGSALILGATHGALLADYNTDQSNILQGPAAPVILWADYAARIPGSQFWSALIFFTLFVLSVCFVALVVQTVMSTFTGRSIRSITWAFLVVICCLFCTIGVITLCTRGGLHVLSFLMQWPVTRPRSLVAAATSTAVTYVYGQTTFCEDVYFAVGEYPCLFMRLSWAVAPFFLTVAFFSGATEAVEATAVAGLSSCALALLPIALVAVAYLIFKCRVRNIVRSEK